MHVHSRVGGGRRALGALGFALALTGPLTATKAEVLTGPIQSQPLGPNRTGPIAVAKPPADRSASCDAACLTGLADRYLDALGRRDFTGLPVAPNLMVAENSHASRIGDGVWRVLERLNPERTYFTDPIAGQVVVLGTLDESAHETQILVLRLKIENRLIAEVETMVTADLDAAQHFRPDGVARFDPVITTVLPTEQRMTREQLIAAGVALIGKSGQGLSAAPDCAHWENGENVSAAMNSRCNVGGGGPPGAEPLSFAQRGVRQVVVDVERGLVLTYLLKDTAPYLNPNPPDHERTPLFYRRRLTLYQMRIAKFVAGDKLLADHVFMNAQEADAPVVFPR